MKVGHLPSSSDRPFGKIRRAISSLLAPSLMASSLLTITGLASSEFLPAVHGQENQLPKSHYFMYSDQPPGFVGQARLQRVAPNSAPIHGYFQPVQVSGPSGLKIALAQEGQFLPLLEAPVRAGMLIGQVYRIRVSDIPNRPGEEVFPTIEVIDRLYAPPGREHRFPIPVVLDQEDIEAALNGELITRVIYLEDSELAEPVNDQPGDQRVVDVSGTDDPLQTADQLGRPVAILRIGSRVPAAGSDLNTFLFGSPPWMAIKPIPVRQNLIDHGIWPNTPAHLPDTQPFRDGNAPATNVAPPTAQRGSSTIRG